MIDFTQFENKGDLFKFLIKNKQTLINQKKAITKEADSVNFHPSSIIEGEKENATIKAITKADPVQDLGNEHKVKVIINTTNLMDSHNDVHLPGLWNKSLSENKSIMHLQEHRMAFDKIISDGEDLKSFVQDFNWKEFGQNFIGKTQALVFESNIRKSRNEFMLNQYANGFVKQHSVGMRYVKLGLAMNDDSNATEFEAWEKYFPIIANKERADEKGFFWFVPEAKIIEGSSVPLGSNHVTPTIDNKNIQPLKNTETEEPLLNTQENDFFGGW